MKSPSQKTRKPRGGAKLRPRFVEFTIRVYPGLGHEVSVRKPYQEKRHGR